MLGFGVLIFLLGLYLIFDYKTDFSHKCHQRHDKALNILKERYARGEISEEEFLTKKNILAE